jgi:hypothetical protein
MQAAWVSTTHWPSLRQQEPVGAPQALLFCACLTFWDAKNFPLTDVQLAAVRALSWPAAQHAPVTVTFAAELLFWGSLSRSPVTVAVLVSVSPATVAVAVTVTLRWPL